MIRALPCLQPSSLRRLATPMKATSCLHLTRSSEYARILSNVYPVHWKMLSIHVVFGLPPLRDPGVVPCSICFSKLSELLRIFLLLLLHGLNARWCPRHRPTLRNDSTSFCPTPIHTGCKYPCCTNPLGRLPISFWGFLSYVRNMLT